jgi:hypothetical protein
MRIFLAIVATCVSMLVTFSLPWSLFLVTRGSTGEASWFLDFLGILVWLGVYLLPLSLVLALGVLWPAELLALRTTRKESRKKIRVTAWMAIAAAVYVAVPSMANPYAAHWAVVCGFCAGAAASLVFAQFVGESDHQSPDAADGNQPTSTR